METACYGCIFAEYKDKQITQEDVDTYSVSESDDPELWQSLVKNKPALAQTIKTQTGCYLKRLDKLQEQGAKIVEAFAADFTEFYAVEEKLCICKRPVEWQNAQSGKSLDELARLCRDEIRMRLHVIIPVHNPKSTIEDVLATVHSLSKQTLKPALITVVINTELKPIVLLREMRQFNDLTWRLKSMTERRSLRDCIDYTVTDGLIKNIAWYSIFNPGFIVPADFVESLDRDLNDNMARWAMLLPYNKNRDGFVCSTKLHESLAGNYQKDVRLKCIKVAKRNNSKFIIGSVQNVCPI